MKELLQHKTTVQKLMDMARRFRSADASTNYDKTYQDLQDAIYEALAQQEPNPWQEAVIDQLVIHHIYQAAHDTDPRLAIHHLLCISNQIALDPRVSSDAQALIDRGRREAQQEQPADAEQELRIDKSWAQFCAGIGDGPKAPYPGMIAAFEAHYAQSFADKDWHLEAGVWAAAWKAAKTQQEQPAQEPVEYQARVGKDDWRKIVAQQGMPLLQRVAYLRSEPGYEVRELYTAPPTQPALTPINVGVTFSRGDIEELPEDQCPEWCAGSSDRDVKVHVHLGDAQPALSDEEIFDLAGNYDCGTREENERWIFTSPNQMLTFARAIEAHYRGGNHG